MAHRQNASQEFALDLIRLSGKGLTRRGTATGPDDYICFGDPVLAMDSGIVETTETRVPDNSAGILPTDDEIRERTETLGYTAGLGGNFVQIRHSPVLFGFYAHLRQGSVTVRPGDSVTRGQVLGEIGNSGHSNGAHLHCQLNDGPKPLGNRSIPMSFTNIRDIHSEPLPMIRQNFTVLHTE